MTKNRTSFLDGDKSLTLEQIAECYSKFLLVFQWTNVLPQIQIDQEDHRMKIRFISLSESGAVISPSVIIEDKEACVGFEKYKTIELTVTNCGLCKGTKTISFNNTVLHKFEKSLELAFDLFKEHYEIAMKADKEQIEWQQVVLLAQNAVGKRKVVDEKGHWKADMLFNVHGKIYDSEYTKLFTIELKDLTPTQVTKLGKVLETL